MDIEVKLTTIYSEFKNTLPDNPNYWGAESKTTLAELVKLLAGAKKKVGSPTTADEARKWAVHMKSAQAIHDIIQVASTSG